MNFSKPCKINELGYDLDENYKGEVYVVFFSRPGSDCDSMELSFLKGEHVYFPHKVLCKKVYVNDGCKLSIECVKNGYIVKSNGSTSIANTKYNLDDILNSYIEKTSNELFDTDLFDFDNEDIQKIINLIDKEQ